MGEFRVVAVASDYEATTEFFIDVMGLEVVDVFDQWDKGIVFAAGDGLIEIFDPTDESPSPAPGAWLAWEVDDADAEHSRLKAAGADIPKSPDVHPWGHKSFRVYGPDGWRITLYQYVDVPSNHSWPGRDPSRLSKAARRARL